MFEKILQNHAKEYLSQNEEKRIMNIVRELKGRGNLLLAWKNMIQRNKEPRRKREKNGNPRKN